MGKEGDEGIVGYSAVVDFVESADVAQVAKRTNLSAS